MTLLQVLQDSLWSSKSQKMSPVFVSGNDIRLRVVLKVARLEVSLLEEHFVLLTRSNENGAVR